MRDRNRESTRNRRAINTALLRKTREAQGITQETLSRLLTTSHAAYNGWERGLKRPHELDVIEIENLLGLERGALYEL